MNETSKATEFTIAATSNFVPSVECKTSAESVKFAKQFYHDDIAIYESAFIILLNQRLRVIGWAKIALGGLASTIVDVRIIAKYAIDSLATGVIFVHNHPSGNMRPSYQDDGITKKIKDGLATLDVRLLDSIILAPDGSSYSYMDEGRL